MSDVRKGLEFSSVLRTDDAYFDDERRRRPKTFDSRLLQDPVTVLSRRAPLIFAETSSTSDAMRAMQSEHSGVVLVTRTGSNDSPLVGVFTERDILLRVINRGRNPAETNLHEVMSSDPECLQEDSKVAWVLNMMAVGGFRHVPVVNTRKWPVSVVSVRDVVEFLVESFPHEILNLPPDFAAHRPIPREGA